MCVSLQIYSSYINATARDSTPLQIHQNKVMFIDSTSLPECVKALSSPSYTADRTAIGSMQYIKTNMLKNGKKLYVFNLKASIGCNINEPERTAYFNDSCKIVASFPVKFFAKDRHKPFVSADYAVSDFPEATKGEYPAYFASLKKADKDRTEANGQIKATYPFLAEKSFKIDNVLLKILDFKKGDSISVSAKNGLKHFRNKKFLNTYKIIPYIIKKENKYVYIFDQADVQYIDIKKNKLYISVFNRHVSPYEPLVINWKPALILTPQ